MQDCFSVIKNSIQEYGQVHRVQKGTKEDIFIQDNYYFLCYVKEDLEQQNLDKFLKCRSVTGMVHRGNRFAVYIR